MFNPIPSPHPPEAALTKWEEHGDCWCSPTKDPGSPVSLGVLMGSSIFPDQVIIEHISSTASAQPGAAPREMELFAFVADTDTYNAVKTMSDEIFKDESQAQTGLEFEYRWVRIATWTYDLESQQNIQAFPVQIDMKALGAYSNRLVVRSKNNWGGEDVPYTCLYRVRVHGERFATAE